jgi:hypothetical protein
MQYIQHLQKKYSLSAFNLLGHTAPAQAASLLLLGPFVDYWLTGNRIDTFHYNNVVTVSGVPHFSLLTICLKISLALRFELYDIYHMKLYVQ